MTPATISGHHAARISAPLPRLLAPLAAAAFVAAAGLPATAAFVPATAPSAACSRSHAGAGMDGTVGAEELAGLKELSGRGLACVPPARRVELLEHPAKPTVISSLTGAHRISSALHRWKAQESEALAVPQLDGRNPLDAYLEGRELETMRREALADTQRAALQAQARVLYHATDFKAAARTASEWIRRQPGRDLPVAYRERIVKAAAAILVASRELQAHDAARARLDRQFDEALDRVLDRG